MTLGFSLMPETSMFCMPYTTQKDLNECTVHLVIRHLHIPLQIEIVMLQETLLSTGPRVKVRLTGTKGIRPAKLLTGLSIGRISTARFLTESEVPGGRLTWEKTTKYRVLSFTTATGVSNSICQPRVFYIVSHMLSQFSS